MFSFFDVQAVWRFPVMFHASIFLSVIMGTTIIPDSIKKRKQISLYSVLLFILGAHKSLWVTYTNIL